MPENHGRGGPPPSIQQPYAFLSYGRTPQSPGGHMKRFHAKLSADLMELTDLGAGIDPVYLDSRTRLGAAWRSELKDHLARCQVLVPVLSRRLFISKWCDVEWQCFERRQQLQLARRTFTRKAVVPVLWTPLSPDEIPRPYADVQYAHDDLGHDYVDGGLFGLLSDGRDRTFNKVVYRLARNIVEVAVSARLEPCDPALFDDLFDPLNGPAGEEH
ncbi:TIR-like protein FxsC [Streptomyces sp. NPDC046197]|uniref:TIR-like protein FxsC n=1 Tax=Streptomyces sp. NPDC046197 TaxID=3154337 RepID=UPI0033EE75CD